MPPQDRLLVLLSVLLMWWVPVLLNAGIAAERTGPAVLLRNLELVHSYLIQVLFFRYERTC